jgi:hypothetical protein
LDERGEEGRLYGGQTAIEATCILGEYRKTAPGLYQESESRDDPTIGNLAEREEKLLTNYAKSTGKWLNRDTIVGNAIRPLKHGEEADVYLYGNAEDRRVEKQSSRFILRTDFCNLKDWLEKEENICVNSIGRDIVLLVKL